ncbi:methylglyoxal synthase [Neptunicella marina]|uniref:Methylglyoxal synthase n=1 Tax=Neptunicella marina TaxID=2125989 RepID=A0A8J6M867_9ALTE|nr:methylglyoxal synthase [Neptunicella marina]MBC3767706.1 methylglyoxal synthase [Neptunicella marina]
MQKTIALVAHDHKKQELIDWATTHKALLEPHKLVATGTTGGLVENALNQPVHKFKSGPLGGDQQIGALISEGKLDALVFFWDPLNPAPHDPDVKALLRLCSVWNIPVACNRASADLMFGIQSLEHMHYKREIPTY